VTRRPWMPFRSNAASQPASSSSDSKYRSSASSRVMTPARAARTTAALRCDDHLIVSAGGNTSFSFPLRGMMGSFDDISVAASL